MPFCSKCGAKVSGKFCADCGSPANESSESPSQVANQQAPPVLPANRYAVLERPDSVRLAVTLLYIGLGISLISQIFVIPSAAKRVPLPNQALLVTFLILAAAYGLAWFVIERIRAGRNWARILLLVLIVIQIPFTVMSFQQLQFQLDPLVEFSTYLGMGILGLQTVAVVFLFQQKSSDWYRHVRDRSQPVSG